MYHLSKTTYYLNIIIWSIDKFSLSSIQFNQVMKYQAYRKGIIGDFFNEPYSVVVDSAGQKKKVN